MKYLSKRAELFIIGVSLFFSQTLEAKSSKALSALIQLTGEAGSGTQIGTEGKGFKYGTDRVRLQYKFDSDNYFGKILLAIERNDVAQQNEVPNLIHEAYGGIKWGRSTKVVLGQLRTPLGMDFHLPGSQLDIIKRGPDTRLLLNWALGLKLQQKLGDHLTMELGHFNPPKRSTAVSGGTPGTHSSLISRIKFIIEKKLHFELSYGNAKKAGGSSTADYHVFDIGFQTFLESFIIKLEYINGLNLLGISGDREEVAYLHLGYQFNKRLQLVVRPYYLKAHTNGQRSYLSNTFMGINFNLDEQKEIKPRLQLNYVLVTGDRDQFFGLGGYRANAFLSMLQFAY